MNGRSVWQPRRRESRLPFRPGGRTRRAELALRTHVVDPAQLAVGALQRTGIDDVDGAGGADVDLDLLLQNLRRRGAALGADRFAALDLDRELVHPLAFGAGEFQLEV